MAFQIDPSHSTIQFSVRHMMVSKARGTFDKWSGSVNLNPEHPEQTTVEITIETDSINTKDAQRDGHLKSPDFFAVEQYPTLTFKSTRVEVTGKEIGQALRRPDHPRRQQAGRPRRRVPGQRQEPVGYDELRL